MALKQVASMKNRSETISSIQIGNQMSLECRDTQHLYVLFFKPHKNVAIDEINQNFISNMIDTQHKQAIIRLAKAIKHNI